jgi:hypothetical protein
MTDVKTWLMAGCSDFSTCFWKIDPLVRKYKISEAANKESQSVQGPQPSLTGASR